MRAVQLHIYMYKILVCAMNTFTTVAHVYNLYRY